MATQLQAVTQDPIDLVATLSLEAGENYLLENSGSNAVRLVSGGTQDTAKSRKGHKVSPGSTITLVDIDDAVWCYVWVALVGGEATSEVIVT